MIPKLLNAGDQTQNIQKKKNNKIFIPWHMDVSKNRGGSPQIIH